MPLERSDRTADFRGKVSAMQNKGTTAQFTIGALTRAFSVTLHKNPCLQLCYSLRIFVSSDEKFDFVIAPSELRDGA